MTPIVPTFKRKQAKQLINFRERGFTLKETAEAMGRSIGTVARYERLYDKFGIEAFAK